ncbi:glutamine-hydrolyzing carbamoyl-phosphate synthase small subunit [Methanobrevibacter curvatus]|uniref:Carbamoyl phosphate synthase small chain n=1 Tax=Methanobrevibacter curvatus TaxID=49547 RepID=A0A165ZF44_9EURY|nr:glutamine-hydrolyzing carbamoyl-phosphate synthase small subunit [Methanobrevibacter curvatus]KZX10631.1 carbamoyl-phosphate synthase small chain [Methanobrevibacter curvatus]
MKKAKLALEDGTIIEGKAFGHETTATGEIVFSTGMCGYVESLTDPSFKGQILMSTYPLCGNYGVSEDWYQSNKIQTEAYVVRELCEKPSKYAANKSLDKFLKEFKIPGISGVDTRDLTIKIREKGTMKAAISTEDTDDSEIISLAKNQLDIGDMDLVPQISTKEVQIFGKDKNKKIAIVDCGIKKNIINSFLSRDIGVILFPYNASSEKILEHDLNGFMISCGPGNPSRLSETIETTKRMHEKFPILGICMGQQILAQSFGASTYKMKFGHRGVNQPVKDLVSGKVFISSQNHGFSVDADSLIDANFKLSQINLNDKTPEGFIHNELPIQSVQYHPEAGPGPNDTSFIFDNFVKQVLQY